VSAFLDSYFKGGRCWLCCKVRERERTRKKSEMRHGRGTKPRTPPSLEASLHPRLSPSLLPSLLALSLTILKLLPPASEQLPLLSLKKMKADESIWPVALKCTCLHPRLGGGDNEPID